MTNFRQLQIDALQAEEQLLAKILEERDAVFNVDEILLVEGPIQMDSVGFAAIQLSIRYAAWSIRRALAETQLLEEQINGHP